MNSVGFIGAGVMGSGMIGSLQRGQWSVRIFDTDRTKVEEAVKRGSLGSDSVHDVATQETIICLSLPGPQQVEETVRQIVAAWTQADRHGIIVDFSTIDPMTAIGMEGVARDSSGYYVEAPVSGGPQGASTGTLAIMVSGDKAIVDDLQPLLNTVGQNIYYVGAPGRAQLIKLCNNVVVGTTMAILGEATILASQAGITPSSLLEILSKSVGNSRTLEVFGPHLVSGRFSPPTFALNLMVKDLGLYVKTAEEYRTPSVVGDLIFQIYRAATMHDAGALDHSAVVKVLEEMGNVAIHR